MVRRIEPIIFPNRTAPREPDPNLLEFTRDSGQRQFIIKRRLKPPLKPAMQAALIALGEESLGQIEAGKVHDLAAPRLIEEINRFVGISSSRAPAMDQLNLRVISLWLLYDLKEIASVVAAQIKTERKLRAAAATESKNNRREQLRGLYEEADRVGAEAERIFKIQSQPRPPKGVLTNFAEEEAYLARFRGAPFWLTLGIAERVGDADQAGLRRSIGAFSIILFGVFGRHPDTWAARVAAFVTGKKIDRREVQYARQTPFSNATAHCRRPRLNKTKAFRTVKSRLKNTAFHLTV